MQITLLPHGSALLCAVYHLLSFVHLSWTLGLLHFFLISLSQTGSTCLLFLVYLPTIFHCWVDYRSREYLVDWGTPTTPTYLLVEYSPSPTPLTTLLLSYFTSIIDVNQAAHKDYYRIPFVNFTYPLGPPSLTRPLYDSISKELERWLYSMLRPPVV